MKMMNTAEIKKINEQWIPHPGIFHINIALIVSCINCLYYTHTRNSMLNKTDSCRLTMAIHHD